jgi:hypothetical protein
MFSGTAEELKETKVTQPMVFFTLRLFWQNIRRFQTRNGCWSFSEFSALAAKWHIVI